MDIRRRCVRFWEEKKVCHLSVSLYSHAQALLHTDHLSVHRVSMYVHVCILYQRIFSYHLHSINTVSWWRLVGRHAAADSIHCSYKWLFCSLHATCIHISTTNAELSIHIAKKKFISISNRKFYFPWFESKRRL